MLKNIISRIEKNEFFICFVKFTDKNIFNILFKNIKEKNMLTSKVGVKFDKEKKSLLLFYPPGSVPDLYQLYGGV